MDVITFILAVFFAVNMGASSFAASLSTAVGSRAITRRNAWFLYIILIVLGAVFLGKEVSVTLSKGIIPSDMITERSVVIILFTATLSLFTANLMHIPQSTSLSTIAAICGVGLFHGDVKWEKIENLAFWWLLSVAAAFFLIYMFTRYVYPPRRRNFWVYEKVVQNTGRLKWFVIITSGYNVFAQGTNNVANVVGPLVGAGMISVDVGLLIMGVIFGLGGLAFTGPLLTTSERIVPLGLLTATIINFVSGSITLAASYFGVPQPAVIIYTMAVFAISVIKQGKLLTVKNPITAKTFFTWCINPIITVCLSYLLSMVFLK